jgi:sulfite exporter TauE/SafE
MIEKALLLGLSTGVYCLGSCMPVLLPLTLGEKRLTPWKRSSPLIAFSLGRLLAYTAFGALVGFLGAQITHPAIRIVMGTGMICLSLALIGYSFIRGFAHFKTCHWFLKSGYVRKLPFLAGIFTGFNICPPFLLVIQNIYTEGSVVYGIGFSLVFYLATSFYLMPFVFLGRFSRMEPVRWVARLSAVLSGCIFFITGLRMFMSI